MVCLLASHYANNGVLTDFQRPWPEGDREGGVIVSRFLPENSSMVSMSPFSHLYMNDVSDISYNVCSARVWFSSRPLPGCF